VLRRRWTHRWESGDDGQEKGEEGHEKAKILRKTRRKGGDIKEKRRERRKEGERMVCPPPLYSYLTVTENHSVHRYHPLILVFPRSLLIIFVACFEYK
jgi:hypothetical protein